MFKNKHNPDDLALCAAPVLPSEGSRPWNC